MTIERKLIANYNILYSFLFVITTDLITEIERRTFCDSSEAHVATFTSIQQYVVFMKPFYYLWAYYVWVVCQVEISYQVEISTSFHETILLLMSNLI